MIIRLARVKDISNISCIGVCVWIDTYATQGVRENISEYVIAEFNVDKISKMLASKYVFVAENESALYGFGVFDQTSKELETLYVLPKFQRSGIGRAMLNFLQSTTNTINLSCWEFNQEALQFYKAYGFREAGECFFELNDEKHRNIKLKYGT